MENMLPEVKGVYVDDGARVCKHCNGLFHMGILPRQAYCCVDCAIESIAKQVNLLTSGALDKKSLMTLYKAFEEAG